jgi:CubicO group peptidase (beta-lactamase class C family)
MKKPILFYLVFLICITTACKKDSTEPSQVLKTNNPMSTDLDKRINEIMSPYAQKSSRASISLGVFKDNQTSYYGYGETKKGNNTIPDSETIYEIGSITKTFTALLMIDYLQSNSLSVECPVNNLLPANIPLLQHNNIPIRIRHLLNHTSVLPRLPDDFDKGSDPDNPYKHYDSTRMYNFLKTFKLTRDPGQTSEYSNLAFGLVGTILERQTHKNYEQLLLEKICNPLGLVKTKIILNKNDSLNFAVGYDDFGNQVPYWDDFNAFKGAGAIRSDVKDMIGYGKTILFSDMSVLKTQIDSCLKVTYLKSSVKQASGWIVQSYNGNEYFIHDGGTAGFNSYILICKNKNIVLVILFGNAPSNNSIKCLNQLIIELLK